MAEVVWTLEALSDLDAIGVYHERTSFSYAVSVVERLYESVTVLQEHEHLGRKVPEIDHDLVRELIVERYRIVYQLIRDQVEIIAVLQSRQDLIERFRDRETEP